MKVYNDFWQKQLEDYGSSVKVYNDFWQQTTW